MEGVSVKTKKAAPVKTRNRLPTEKAQSVKRECHSHRTKSNRNIRAESAEVLANIKALL